MTQDETSMINDIFKFWTSRIPLYKSQSALVEYAMHDIEFLLSVINELEWKANENNTK